MCGIAGMFAPRGVPPDAREATLRMLAAIRHRGPDQFGVCLDNEATLGSVRLSIIDPEDGQQPIANADRTLWIVYNGEVFNYLDLRSELEAAGHRFTTRTDTEVVLHLYEQLGPACLSRLNGQFALAIWDSVRRRLFLARDRFGVRPLFYTRHEGTLFFGSEVKALLNAAPIGAELDPATLRDIFTVWSPLPGRTAFRDVLELPPAHYLMADRGSLRIERYWQLRFPAVADARAASAPPPADAAEACRELLVDAVRLRLRADVPVGAYLSGGLDSSTISAVARQLAPGRLRTFSIAFTDTGFDEREHQQRMARFLGTDHEVLEATHDDIAGVFPEVVWHAEVPLLRTAPAPMFLLSRAVRDAGFKVVLTGEGADEFFAGYDIFKEAKVREFWARAPNSRLRPLLLSRLHRDVFADAAAGSAFLAPFYRQGLEEVAAPEYSHAIRWRTTRRNWRFLADDVLATAGPVPDVAAELCPEGFGDWPLLARAQFLEATLFLPQYLLSSQGDRVALAHSVEGRFPFLDPRLVEFCTSLPTAARMPGLLDKRLLREVAAHWLPSDVARRPKRPYRAPIHRSFFNRSPPEYVRELLEAPALRRAGLFKPAVVGQLHARLEAGTRVGETDDMALCGILSTQLVHRMFCDRFRRADPLRPEDGKMCYPAAKGRER
jgi:asparagine synthase (glutamine-hydrolysing)